MFRNVNSGAHDGLVKRRNQVAAFYQAPSRKCYRSLVVACNLEPTSRGTLPIRISRT